MTRNILIVTLIAAALSIPLALPGSAVAEPTGEPIEGFVTPEDVEWARHVAEATPLRYEPGWERTGEPFETSTTGARSSLRASDDDDTAHYARGHTLIIHVFINHGGGTWDATEMAAAGADAEVAKDYFRQRAPVAANLYFDHEGTTGYYYWTVSLPDTIGADSTANHVYAAIQALGFTDVDGDLSYSDDFSKWHQNWSGGWDNVICVYQAADIGGRAWASYGTGSVIVYPGDGGATWAHEFGHSFGACDEYVEGGKCNGGIDCGACQSWYLHTTFDNENCDLVTCPDDVDCLMRNNTFANICGTTLEHWAWVDDDANQLLDTCKRRVSGTSFVNIYELLKDGYFLWNQVHEGMSYSQADVSWAVTGIRSRGTADYDLDLYLDNNHNLPVASSAYGAVDVDFVVADYNHTRLGNEHVQVTRWSGPTDHYDLQWESGTSVLFPDGAARSQAWTPDDVVTVWDVPLFAGESVWFYLEETSGTLDLGMALFRSNGDSYFAGRAGREWEQDVTGIGVDESWNYTVPADDVYGLVVWSNTRDNGTCNLRIGPPPSTLPEETAIASANGLELYNYDPNAAYWSFVGSRGFSGTNTDVKLFDDATYQTELEKSDSYGDDAVEFVAVDYNHEPVARDHVRVARIGGTLHTTEWEHDAEILSGATSTTTWPAGHVGKVWDAWLLAGQDYFFREYHSSLLDTGLYLFGSDDGDYAKPRSAAAISSDVRPAINGGEWFRFTPGTSDWHGVYLVVNDQSTESYSVWFGPDVPLADEVTATASDRVVFASGTTSTPYWHVFAARSNFGPPVDVWLYGDDAYTATTIKASDQGGGGGVNYVVGDYNHDASGPVYPRFLNPGGGAFDFEYEGESELILFSGGDPTTLADTWPAGDVAEAYDLWIGLPTTVHVRVEDLSGNLDLGVALFASSGGVYYANDSDALAVADAQGVGGTETLNVSVPGSDYYGLIVTNNSTAGGDFRIVVGESNAVVAPNPVPTRFEFAAAPNPFRSAAELRFALPRSDRVELGVYDVGGRLVRRLLARVLPPGRHEVQWDGRDSSGRAVGAGVYLARMRTSDVNEVRKLTRSQ